MPLLRRPSCSTPFRTSASGGHGRRPGQSRHMTIHVGSAVDCQRRTDRTRRCRASSTLRPSNTARTSRADPGSSHSPTHPGGISARTWNSAIRATAASGCVTDALLPCVCRHTDLRTDTSPAAHQLIDRSRPPHRSVVSSDVAREHLASLQAAATGVGAGHGSAGHSPDRRCHHRRRRLESHPGRGDRQPSLSR